MFHKQIYIIIESHNIWSTFFNHDIGIVRRRHHYKIKKHLSSSFSKISKMIYISLTKVKECWNVQIKHHWLFKK